MKRLIVSTTLCISALLCSFDASAQRMQDLSLPVDQSTSNTGGNKPFQNDITRRTQQFDKTKQAPTTPITSDNTALPSKSFMEGYCDPSFVSMLANNRKYFGQEQCLGQVRDDACARFKALPREVKDVLDEAVGCMFANSNGYAIDKNQPVDNQSIECGASYARRIEMLKKYYTDYYANYALLFMPDDILDTPGRCVNRN